MYQMAEYGGTGHPVTVALYTDAYVIRGTIHTRTRRLSDILNEAEHEFVVLADAVMDEYGSRAPAMTAEYVQVNLGAVLFAVSDSTIEPLPELRTPKVAEQALISIPPFRITGRIHLLPERDLRMALEELTGRFVPVTDVTFWSESLGEAHVTAPMLAFNHSRAQILAPHREVDPWAGLDRGPGATGSEDASADPDAAAPDAIGAVPSDAASTSLPTGSQDPWTSGSTGTPGTPTPGAEDLDPSGPSNPWGGPGGDPWGAGRRRDEDAPAD